MKLDFSKIDVTNVVSASKQVLGAMAHSDYTVDLSSLEELDSTVVAAALQWLREAKKRGGKLQVINAPDKFWNIAELYRVKEYFE